MEFYKSRKFKELLLFSSKKSKFYSEKFGYKTGEDLCLMDLPFLSKEEIRNVPLLDMVTGELEEAIIFRSGGTTGKPSFSIFSNQEFDVFTDLLKKTYQKAGLVKKDRVANLFLSGDLYASFSFVNRVLEKTGCLNFPFGATKACDELIELVNQFQINVLMGVTSQLLSFFNHVKEKNLFLPSLEKIFYAGEHFFEKDIQAISQYCNLKKVRSGGYAAVDAGVIGYQCEFCENSMHHLHSRNIHLEILGEDGNLQKNGEYGEIVVTDMKRKLMPIIRFRLGDQGRILDEQCKCGSSDPLFELKGRMSDFVRIASSNIYLNELQELFSAYKNLSSNIQLVHEVINEKERLTINLELYKSETGVKEKIEEHLLTYLNQSKEKLKYFIETGAIYPVKVNFFSVGELQRNPRTGKLVRIIDKRF